MTYENHALTPEEREFFVQHGWLKVKNAIDRKYVDLWLSDLWTRLGWDPDDKSTWREEFLKMPRHREVPAQEFCPKAWAKILEIVGGEDKLDPVRERYHGDQFIVNFGSERLLGKPESERQIPQENDGWHHDNDWYRQFLDSSGNALTIIHCFTDVPKGGGGTMLCEDGIKGICQKLYDHPEGLDPPFTDLYNHCKQCSKFATVEAEAGDVIITHGLLPHASSDNHNWFARVITNPHVNLSEPWNLNRPDGNYTLCEQVILRALGRQSIPEYRLTRPRLVSYPRTAYHKRARVEDELKRMIAEAERQGLSRASVDSIYLGPPELLKEHEKRNGYDAPWGPNGVQLESTDLTGAFPTERQTISL